MRRRWRVRGFGILAMVLLAAAAFGVGTMWLWNTLMPVLFQLPVISFWQAIGLLVLSRLFFGGFHGRRGWGRRRPRFMSEMTTEERERIRAKFGKYCREGKEV